MRDEAGGPAIAAFVYRPNEDVAPLLTEVARQLRLRGVAMAGAIQHNEGPCTMWLELLPPGRRMMISQPAAVAGSCKLDTGALAEAAAAIRREIDAGPQLAIINKFSTQEAAGAGLCAEMAAAVLSGIPLLTAVSESVLDRWTVFTGGSDVRLAHAPEAALAWWDALQG